jgi:hypothetical protein
MYIYVYIYTNTTTYPCNCFTTRYDGERDRILQYYSTSTINNQQSTIKSLIEL